MIRALFLHRFLPRLAAAALVILAGVGELQAVTAPAKIAYLEGKVMVKRRGEDKPVPAELGMSLFYGDMVQTQEGKCQINMTASGILRMPPGMLVSFPAESNEGDTISVLKMLKGKTMKNFENLWNDEVFEVRTPSLVAGTTDSDYTGFKDRPFPQGGKDDGKHGDKDRKDGKKKKKKDGGGQGKDKEKSKHADIDRIRAEGNAKLDAIRAELKRLEGKPVNYPCGACGSNGPHRWTTDGWECNCGATAVTFGNYPTSHGRYNAVRDRYRKRIGNQE